MQKKRFLCILTIILLTCLCITNSGCWDRIEIEKNAFILGMGIDLADNKSRDILVTYQIALPDAMKGGGEGGGGGGNKSSTLNITIKAKNLKSAEQLLATNIDRYPNYNHMQIIIFGEGLCRNGIEKYMDFFFRNPQSRRLTQIAVSEGPAKDIFEFNPKTSKSTAQYLGSLIKENNKYSLQITSYVDLAILEQNFARKSDFTLAKVILDKKAIKMQGAGIFKNGKMVEWLGQEEIAAVKWIRNEIKQGVFNIAIPEKMGGEAAMQILSSSTKIKPNIKDDKLIFDVKINLEEDISELETLKIIAFKKNFIELVEKETEQQIKNVCKRTFKKIRDSHSADIFEFGRKVEAYYPKFWSKNKKEWTNYYKNAEINVQVDANVRRMGLIK